MTTYEELLTQVTAAPEDDEPRYAFARHVRASDPAYAKFIEDQLVEAMQRRSRRGGRSTDKHPLLARHEESWARAIAKYVRSWEFDRGFITQIEIDPEIFLEYGEYLFVLAPIRKVAFVAPEDGVFPMAALAASPLLERLVAVAFLVPTLTEADLEMFASSPFLSRMLMVSSQRLQVSTRVYESFAATAHGRRMLYVRFSGESFPGRSLEDSGKDDWWGAPILEYTPLKPEGLALERQYGYIPWLHPDENLCDPLDAEYYVVNGILPVKPPGSPV